MNKIQKILSAFAILMISSTTYAIPVKFSFMGKCGTPAFLNGCGNIDNPSSVDGYLVTDDALIADNFFTANEITDFSFTFGSLMLNPASHPDVSGPGYRVSPLLELLADPILNGFRFEGPGSTGGGVGIIDLGFIELSGWAVHTQERSSGKWKKIAWGTGGFGAGVTSVPEPTSFALMGIGLLGFGLVRRKRKTA